MTFVCKGCHGTWFTLDRIAGLWSHNLAELWTSFASRSPHQKDGMFERTRSEPVSHNGSKTMIAAHRHKLCETASTSCIAPAYGRISSATAISGKPVQDGSNTEPFRAPQIGSVGHSGGRRSASWDRGRKLHLPRPSETAMDDVRLRALDESAHRRRTVGKGI